LCAKEIRAMPAAVKLREDFSAQELRALARRAKDVNQSRRLLSLAAVRDGKDRAEAAQLGGMDRQTLRDWVHRFNASGPEGLFDHWTEGPKPRLSAEQLAELASLVEAGPDREKDGVVRWRKLDMPKNITPILLPSRAPELNPVENVWQYLRQNWLSNRVFENYDAIIDAACDAWQRLTAQPETITSIRLRDWAHIGHAS
jgi:transposase